MSHTQHWEERSTRLQFIKNNIGIGIAVNSFIEDKGHSNGPELHTITSTGLIVIRNFYSKKLVTVLIARPQQIKRYYIARQLKVPKNLVDIAYAHSLAGYNQR